METTSTSTATYNTTTTTTISVSGIENMGINPKHPNENHEYHDHDIIHLMEDAKHIMNEWNITIVPKIEPVVNRLLQQVNDITTPTTTTTAAATTMNAKTELEIIYDQTMDIQERVNTMYDQLHHCKIEMYDAMQIHQPMIEATKYLSPISKLSIFGKPHMKTEQQDILENYYVTQFLHQYETATIEYRNIVHDKCQYILDKCKK